MMGSVGWKSSILLLASPILSAAVVAFGWAQTAPASPKAPSVVVDSAWSNVPSTQTLIFNVSVSAGSGNPTPTGVVTLMSNNPPPRVYDTFQHPDGTLIKGLTTQSGNSVWIVTGDGIGEVENSHLLNTAPSGESGALYAALANSSVNQRCSPADYDHRRHHSHVPLGGGYLQSSLYVSGDDCDSRSDLR